MKREMLEKFSKNPQQLTKAELIEIILAYQIELKAANERKPVSPIKLLKSSNRDKDGKRWDNLYIQVGESSKYAPIGIKLATFNPKQKNLLLALATSCEIRRVTLVTQSDNLGAPAVVDDGEGDKQ